MVRPFAGGRASGLGARRDGRAGHVDGDVDALAHALRDYAEVLGGLQSGVQRFVRDGISGVNRDLDSTDTEALVLVAYELNAHFGAEPLHDDTAPLEAESQARREAVSDGRSEDSHRIGRGIVSERCGLVHAEARVLLLVEVDAEVETVHLLDPKRKFTGGTHTHKIAQTAPRRAAAIGFALRRPY